MSLLSKNLEQLKAASGYKFSGTKMGDLTGALEYTLATLVLDTSSSVDDYRDALEQVIKTVVGSLKMSPRVDNLMFRLTTFNDKVTEQHGFKLLATINPDDYTGIVKTGGMTALFEAMDEAIQATATYGRQLTAKDYTANGIIFIVTDGQNNRGTIMDPVVVAKSAEVARKTECMESILVVLIGVTTDNVNLDFYLTDVKNGAKCDQYVALGVLNDANAEKKLAKLAQFISQSTSSQSSQLGTGKASQPLPPGQFNF